MVTGLPLLRGIGSGGGKVGAGPLELTGEADDIGLDHRGPGQRGTSLGLGLLQVGDTRLRPATQFSGVGSRLQKVLLHPVGPSAFAVNVGDQFVAPGTGLFEGALDVPARLFERVEEILEAFLLGPRICSN